VILAASLQPPLRWRHGQLQAHEVNQHQRLHAAMPHSEHLQLAIQVLYGRTRSKRLSDFSLRDSCAHHCRRINAEVRKHIYLIAHFSTHAARSGGGRHSSVTCARPCT